VYYVPYQEDSAQAFQQLRQEVSEAAGYDRIVQQLAEVPAEEVDEALAASVEGGTGTIYDLGEVEAFKRFSLVQYFGTVKPTKHQAETTLARGDIWNSLPSWTGYYAILYENDTPHEILFVGMTGD
jgi:hypothetical protein